MLDNTFSESRNLKSVNLNKVRTVKLASFMNSPMLESVVIQESMDSITDCCFNECKSLKRIELPCKEIVIEDSFNGCQAIEEIVLKAGNPYPFPESSFKDVNYPRCRLIVPVGSGDLYRNTDGWNRFGTIEEYNFSKTDCLIEDRHITLESDNGVLKLTSAQPCEIYVYRIDGTVYGKYSVEERLELTLPSGGYIIHTPDSSHKIFI